MTTQHFELSVDVQICTATPTVQRAKGWVKNDPENRVSETTALPVPRFRRFKWLINALMNSISKNGYQLRSVHSRDFPMKETNFILGNWLLLLKGLSCEILVLFFAW